MLHFLGILQIYIGLSFILGFAESSSYEHAEISGDTSLNFINGDQRSEQGKRINVSADQYLLSIDSTPDVNPYEHTEQAPWSACTDYIEQFLNVTTDANDICVAISNAYQGANCDNRVFIDDDDDVFPSNNNLMDAIDDLFEEYQCCNDLKSMFDENCSSDDRINNKQLLEAMLIVTLCGFLKGVINYFRLRWMTEAGICIIVGIIVGGIRRAYEGSSSEDYFNNNVFMFLLLPPIILEAALTINKPALFSQIFSISIFALLGTITSTIFTGCIVHGLTSIPGDSVETIPWLESLLFGALISSIDPIAVLSVLSGLGMKKTDKFYVQLFGESLLNDAVAITLFRSFNGFLKESHPEDAVIDVENYPDVALDFILILGGSLVTGLICGVISTIIFWSTYTFNSSVGEVVSFFVMAFVPYYFSDVVEWSGIVSIVAAGIFMDVFLIGSVVQNDAGSTHWESPSDTENTTTITSYSQIFSRPIFSKKGHVRQKARENIHFVAEVFSNLAETALFMYLGLYIYSSNTKWSVQLNAIAIFSAIGSRALMICFITVCINLIYICFPRMNSDEVESVDSPKSSCFSEKRRVQFAMIIAGLRGGVSFALVESIPIYDVVTGEGTKYKGELKAMTSATIMFTIFLFGGSAYYIIQALGLVKDDRLDNEPNENELDEPLMPVIMTEVS